MPRLFSIKPTLTMRGRKFKGIRGWAGKPLHPPLTDIPVACYFLMAVFDVVSFISHSRNDTSTVANDFFISGTHVVIAGAIASVPTILTGFWDWLKSTPPRTQAWRTANWHMAVMSVMSIIVVTNIVLRLGGWDGGYATGTVMALSVVIAALVAFGSMYGGALVYEYNFNVETLRGQVWEESESDIFPYDKE